jgi:hypothetical protein
MQYFFFALLFLPLLLHGYVLPKRESQLDPALVDSHQLSQVKNEKPLDDPTVVEKVDHRTRSSDRLTTRPHINPFPNPDDPIQQFEAESAKSSQRDSDTTNVMREPRKRDVDVDITCDCNGLW